MKRMSWMTAALAVPLLLVSQAKADFSYTTAVVPLGPNSVGALSHETFGDTAGGPGLAGSQNVALANVSVDSTQSQNTTDTGSIAYTINMTIVQDAADGDTPGTGLLVIKGILNFTRLDDSGETSTNTFVAAGSILSVTIGARTYTIANPALDIVYAAPTISGNAFSQGTISGLITTAVPEPASMALMGLGGLGLAALARRGRKARA